MTKAIVLGGYGLIGAACCRALVAAGFAVTAVGRSRSAAQRGPTGVAWVFADLARITPAAWADLLADADVVVNAAGALQDGARDNLVAIHETAVRGLVAALHGRRTRLVQISAAGVSEGAPTEFLRSKARGDGLILTSALDWVILRPTLVLGAQAYGGTALLRAAAAVPGVFLRVLPEVPVQTVWVGDLAAAVVQAAQGRIRGGTVAEVTEPAPRSLAETLMALRGWLGLPAWRRGVTLPWGVLRAAGRVADFLGWLGWRSPLRSAALQSLRAGVTGSPEAWVAAGGTPCRALPDTLAQMPATTQELWFARLWLLLPLGLATLAGFWIASGVIGLIQGEAARRVLTARGMAEDLAGLAVRAGAVTDIALGLAVLVRRLARPACLGMVAVTTAYCAGATLLAPDLWADPLGPLVKVLPGLTLALMVAALLDER